MEIHYKFTFDTGIKKDFKIQLDKETLGLIAPPKERYPEWTTLKFSKCSHCPLNEDEHVRCPIAANLVDFIDFFKDLVSFHETDIIIETKERNYTKHTDIQNGTTSLIGIYMVTSGCPVMDKLRPLVRFHLPFATVAENIYRSISMYLFAQYFIEKQGKQPDWKLEKLGDFYKDISKVNMGFSERFNKIVVEDASLNAIAHLDCFAQGITFSLEDLNEESLKSIGLMQSLFKAYLN